MDDRNAGLPGDAMRAVVIEPADATRDEAEVDLFELILNVLRDWKLLLAAMVLCAALAVVLLARPMGQAQYVASTMIYLEEEVEQDLQGEDLMRYLAMKNSSSSYDVVKEYSLVALDGSVLQRVIDELGLTMSKEALTGRITLTTESKSRLVGLSVQAEDEAMSRDILEKLREVSIESLTALRGGKPVVVGFTEIDLAVASAGSGRSAKKMAALGGIAGLFLMALLSAILSIFDDRVRNPGEAARSTGLPVLARTDREDALNALRGNLTLRYPEAKAICLTGDRACEKRSALAYGLAERYAAMGKRAIYVECAARERPLDAPWNGGKGPALTDYLVGKAEIGQIIRHAGTSLDAVAGGDADGALSELFSGERLGALIQALGRDYERVIVNAPAMDQGADAAMVASRCDGTLLVAETGKTRRDSARSDAEELKQDKIRLFGTVLVDSGKRRGGVTEALVRRFGRKS